MTIGPPYWSDRPVFLIGGGSSLRGFDFSKLADLKAYVVGVNHSMFDAPAHAGVTIDQNWMRNNYEKLCSIARTGIELFLAPGHKVDSPVPLLRRRIHSHFSDDPDCLHTIGSSGYAALNLAYLKQARDVILMGYDYDDGGLHYHDYYKPGKAYQPHWSEWAEGYKTALDQIIFAGMRVWNANPNSAISVFPKITMDQALSYGR